MNHVASACATTDVAHHLSSRGRAIRVAITEHSLESDAARCQIGPNRGQRLCDDDEMANNKMSLREFDPPLAVEVLVHEVRADAYERWKQADHEFWTIAEAELFPAYAGKEVWLSPGGEFHKVTMIIYWNDLDAWQSIDPAWIEEQERRFSEVVGADNYRLVSESHHVEQYYKVSEYR
jgi:uncharacterized protein (TIGR03792 family)